MFNSYLKIAIRSLYKYKLYAGINIFGLAIGFTCCFLIALFVLDELSYDSQYADADRIYRVSRDFYAGPQNNESFMAANAPNVAPLLKEDFPDIELVARIYGGRALLGRGDTTFFEDNIRFADNQFFQIFNLEWISGSPDRALLQPSTLVLTESIAKKYFGSEDPMGQEIKLENSLTLTVTGVIKDFPHNTHLSADIIASFSTLTRAFGNEFVDNWGSNNFHTYIKIPPATEIESIESQFPDFMERHYAEGSTRFTGMSTMPLLDIHLFSTRLFEMTPPGKISTVYTFSAIALCILIIACINFTNLSVARSSQRSKEVGIRKSMGAGRSQIISQFLGESILFALLALLISIALVELLMPAFKPSKVLKGNLTVAASGALFRSTLVIFQFGVAIALVIATMVVFLQMKFAEEVEFGFEKEQIVVLSGSPTTGLGSQWPVLKQQLLSHPQISAVTASNVTPLEDNGNGFGVWAEGDPDGRTSAFMLLDYDFFKTYDIELLAGRVFSEDRVGDPVVQPDAENSQTTGNYILNASSARSYNWSPEEAVGKVFEVYINGGFASGTVIGVVTDSYFESLRNAIKPMVFLVPAADTWGGFPVLDKASIKVSENDLEETLAYIDEKWQEFLPEIPITRHFLNDDFESLYQTETQQSKIFSYFALLSISIACMGLFALATFNTERRRKEIGVRKVMGGSVWNIVLLLTNDFSKLVLFSNLIAWPIGYFAMQRWLENFAYRIDLTPLIFIGSGLIALCIAWVTVGGMAARAANAKPVLALRYE